MADVDTWKEEVVKMLTISGGVDWTRSERARLGDDLVAALPDIARQAGKRIANQPELWCKGEYHRAYDEQPRDWRTGRFIPRAMVKRTQSCALGHVEDLLFEQFGNRALRAASGTWGILNDASLSAVGVTIPEVNDYPETTPQTIADHMFAVADELEFGHGS